MEIASEWSDYKVIASGGGEKLEKFGNYTLLRPDPQVIWRAQKDLADYKGIDARYVRSSSGGGEWQMFSKLPEEWIVAWRNLKFKVKPMNFKHTGIFPEQAVNWAKILKLITDAKSSEPSRDINVLNLFAYTGGATLAAMSAGASVCHVDAAKGMVERAAENVKLSNLPSDKVRYIVDDCKKFVEREIRRGKTYDAVIMDPPSYGRGPSGEIWKLEDDLYDFIMLVKKVMSDRPLFFLVNSYTTGLQPAVLNNLIKLAFKDNKGTVDSYEVCLPTEENIVLPCGASGIFIGNK